MRKRPVSVTAMAWILIVMGVGLLMFPILSAIDRLGGGWAEDGLLPALMPDLAMAVILFIPSICGFGLLGGRNWARFLYIGWMTAMLGAGLAAEPRAGQPSAWAVNGSISFFILTFVIALILFCPKAAAYFHASEPTEHGLLTRGVVTLAVPAGFFKMRISLAAMLALNAYMSVLLTCVLLASRRRVDAGGWANLGLAVFETLLWAVGLRLWRRAIRVGYWWVWGLVHLSFLAAVARLDLDPTAGAFFNLNLVKLAFLAFMLVNLGSRRLREFFPRVDGKCPLCLDHSCREPGSEQTWTCPGCGRTVARAVQT